MGKHGGGEYKSGGGGDDDGGVEHVGEDSRLDYLPLPKLTLAPEALGLCG